MIMTEEREMEREKKMKDGETMCIRGNGSKNKLQSFGR